MQTLQTTPNDLEWNRQKGVERVKTENQLSDLIKLKYKMICSKKIARKRRCKDGNDNGIGRTMGMICILRRTPPMSKTKTMRTDKPNGYPLPG
jgi:hypothetical protein